MLDISHSFTVFALAAGRRINLINLKNYFEGVRTPRSWPLINGSGPGVLVGISGVALAQSDTDTLPILPDFGDFRFGLQLEYFYELEAITDFSFACVAPTTEEAYMSYKLITKSLLSPDVVSSDDGLYVLIISGAVDINGTEYRTGGRYTLTPTSTTLTPIGSDLVQYIIIADRNQPEPTSIPRSVSPRQIRQALTQVGLRANVEAAVAAGSQDLKDWWEFATLIERANPQVVAMGTGLGMTATQMDDLFTLAASL